MNNENIGNSDYGNFAEFYDRLVGGFDYTATAEYYDGLIRENGINSGILLDLACGTGTLSAMFAERGWDVIGVDISPEMLSLAKKHEKVSYICQDMTELDLYGTVDAAVCCFDALNHLLEEPELLKTFGRVSLFMNTGGVFVFDMNTVYCHETILGDNIFIKQSNSGIYCVWRNASRNAGTVDITLDIFAKQANALYSRYVEEIRETAYSLETVRSLCEKSGFEVKACFDFMNHNSGNEDCEKVVFVCMKL
ncbi:MAG: methyltransferase domain-containing protein [Oscillospiraceae bacterium]|nr:methyltransferase domain-containing protein [Oscillospiraceae bacterium]